MFAFDSKNPGATTKTKCYANTIPGTEPIRTHPYRTSINAINELKKQVSEMLSSGIINKSNSPWAFPVVLALKSDGSWRFCVDYSKLNQKTKRDSFPLPNIEEYLDRLSKAKVFTVLDFASGFWQIPINEEDKEKFSFITSFGTYHFNFMPFGFINAPSIFQRAISETLDPLLYICCLVYIDDVVVFSNDIESHYKDLNEVFKLLEKYNWKVKLSKCQFVTPTINYLGHEVSNGEVKPITRNLEKLKNMKKPQTQQEMISFLGFTGYYKKFIQGYDYLVHPLRKYTLDQNFNLIKHKTHQFKHKNNITPQLIQKIYILDDDEEAINSYNKIINLLSTQPILKLFNNDKEIIIKTDVSAFAWGAALVQVYDGIEHPVQFASGNLNSSQRNWPAWKREMYGVLKAIQKWHHYVVTTQFTVITDHQANVYLLDPNKSHPPIINNWKILLSQYTFTVIHRPGKTLVLEDGLSRSPNLLLLELNDIKEKQKEDKLIIKILNFINNKTPLDEETKKLLNFDIKNHFIIKDDILFYIESNSKYISRRILRIFLPKSMITTIFDHRNLPNKGHLGFNRTYEDIVRQYYCPDLYNEITKLFKECHTCQTNKITRLITSEPQSIIATEPFEILEMDHIIVNNKSKNNFNYILVVTDVFSRKSWFLPSITLEATEVFKLLFIHIFSQFFFPKNIYSDLSKTFNNELDQLICQATNIKHSYTLPYTKGHTASVENRNKVVEMIITKFVEKYDQSNWDEYCWTAAYAYNKSVSHSSFSPDHLIFGREPYNILDLSNIKGIKKKYEEHVEQLKDDLSKAWKISKEITNKSINKYKNNILKSLHNKPSTFNIGQLVLLSGRGEPFDSQRDQSIQKKFTNRNLGPFEITNIDNFKHVTLQLTPSKTQQFHIDQITTYHGNEKPFPPNHFTPSLNEIIKIQIPKTRNQTNNKEKPISDKNKSKFNIKTIVGQRINILWNQNKSYYKATVIGYTSNLNFNLIFFDEPTIINNQITDDREDYFKAKLFKSENSKSEKLDTWSLLK